MLAVMSRWILGIAGLVLTMVAAGRDVSAQTAACPPYRKPITLDFKTLNPKPIYNNRLNVQGIRNLFREHTDNVVGPHERALGITYAETQYTADANSRAESARGGGYCVYLTNVNIAFGFKRMSVYVASEFKPGTCEYRAILDHENQHVAVNTAVLREYAPRFRAEVERVLSQQQPVRTRDPQAGMDQALVAVGRRMSALLNEFQDTTARRNAPLDSSHNYGETGKLCQNWNGAGVGRE
jgi:hypothetical protein